MWGCCTPYTVRRIALKRYRVVPWSVFRGLGRGGPYEAGHAGGVAVMCAMMSGPLRSLFGFLFAALCLVLLTESHTADMMHAVEPYTTVLVKVTVHYVEVHAHLLYCLCSRCGSYYTCLAVKERPVSVRHTANSRNNEGVQV